MKRTISSLLLISSALISQPSLGLLPLAESISWNKAPILTQPQKDSVLVYFDPQSDKLNKAGKEKIHALIDKVNLESKAERISVVAWSDKSLHSSDAPLTAADKNLADRRADEIRRYIKSEFTLSQVVPFNMAENASWMSKAFDADGTELKSIFAKENSPLLSDQEFQVVKELGRPGVAVIIVKRRD